MEWGRAREWRKKGKGREAHVFDILLWRCRERRLPLAGQLCLDMPSSSSAQPTTCSPSIPPPALHCRRCLVLCKSAPPHIRPPATPTIPAAGPGSQAAALSKSRELEAGQRVLEETMSVGRRQLQTLLAGLHDQTAELAASQTAAVASQAQLATHLQ